MQSKAESDTARILVRSPNWIGDCIMSSRMLHRLRSLYPEANIDLLCRPHLSGIFEMGIPVDRIMTTVMSGTREHPLATAKLIRQSRPAYDLGFLLTNSFLTALEFRLAGVRRRIGYARDGRSWLLSSSLKTPSSGHQLDLYDHLLSPLTQELPPVPSSLLRVPSHFQDELDHRLTRLGIELDEPPWIMAPSAAYGTAKQWPLERFAGVMRGLLEHFPRRSVLCLGGPGDRDLVQTLFRGMNSDRAHNLAGRLPLTLSMALISRAAGVLANDSGLMHAAWALDVPLVAVFGPNDPQVSGPRSSSARVLYKKAECSPCRHRHCPIDHRCMTAITVEETLEAMIGLADQESGR